MTKTNIASEIDIDMLTAPVNKTETWSSDACHVSGHPGVEFCVAFGDSGDTLASDLCWDCKLTECATEGGTYTDVDDDEVYGNTTNQFGLVNAPTEDQAVYSLGYNGTLDYVKVKVTATGTHSTGTPIGVFALKGMPRTLTSDRGVNP